MVNGAASLDCFSLSFSLSNLQTQVWVILKPVKISFTLAASNEVTRLSLSSCSDERDNPFSWFSLPLACRLFADCKAAALEKTLRSLTCFRSTFICINKNKSHVASPTTENPWRVLQRACPLSSCPFSSWRFAAGFFVPPGGKYLRVQTEKFIIIIYFFYWLGEFKWSMFCHQERQDFHLDKKCVFSFKHRGQYLICLHVRIKPMTLVI